METNKNTRVWSRTDYYVESVVYESLHFRDWNDCCYIVLRVFMFSFLLVPYYCVVLACYIRRRLSVLLQSREKEHVVGREANNNDSNVNVNINIHIDTRKL